MNELFTVCSTSLLWSSIPEHIVSSLWQFLSQPHDFTKSHVIGWGLKVGLRSGQVEVHCSRQIILLSFTLKATSLPCKHDLKASEFNGAQLR